MACHSASSSLSSSINNCNTKFFRKSRPAVVICSISNRAAPFNTLISEAVKHLVPAARFEASKLEVVIMEDEINEYSRIIPRTYILSHCDFTANLTLTISNVINLDQLRGWYFKDDVVAEWKKLEGQLALHIHCYVSGPNLMLDLAAELRYHIFSKEMPLVLEAVLHGDSVLFAEHPELLESLVWVYFHSCSPNYNRMECWGPLKDAAKGRRGDHVQAYSTASKTGSDPSRKWLGPKSIFQALFALLL
ncbi:magnesium dechelatase SGRL, chloroplastic [Mercurialis annua]|uniref:magnesium dechelatase SGRL, chloroplastic n=1 Tax=Mercurialis annua TaxID=3986 RepID=UPI00215ECA29|nr:magnesium dechelatase SGRL, chloroplastic [Mercurialis annua]